MPTQSVTLQMPQPLYERLRRSAKQSHRTIEEESLDALAAGMPVDDELPEELAASVRSLDLLDDDALWTLAARKTPAEDAAEMEALHRDQRIGGLSREQTARLAELVRSYESNMLTRAHAALLLKQRGHDINSLRAP